MSAGLYTKYNLSEKGLNATDALQKLYGPQVHQDLLLFSFASGLESEVSSPSNDSDNQIYGLLNQPISDSTGAIFQRTKFITQGRPNPAESLQQSIYTFSDNNLVWFDRIPNGFDKRLVSETTGAPIKVSVNGSLVAASVIGTGKEYTVLDSNNVAVSLPSTVNVRVIGLESGADNAVVQVTVNSDGTIDRLAEVVIVTPGSGYIDQELLELIPACSGEDIPSEDKCLNYTGNALYQSYYVNGQVSPKALLRNERYTYRVRYSGRDGFFLYDDKVNDYVFLGSAYNSLQQIIGAVNPLLVVKRQDVISSENLVQLYNLNGRSSFFSYGNGYASGDSIGSTIRALSDRVEELQDGFRYFVQNARNPLTESDERNNLGTRYNIIDGRNINSNYRMVFRDPDGVLDQTDEEIGFFQLKELTEPYETTLSGMNIPGIWLWTGDKYQRVFSSDDKPFMNQQGKKYLSPAIYAINSSSELAESGQYKYSVNAGYLNSSISNPTVNNIRGFDTQISILVQNVSSESNPKNGGFVYHRSLSPETIRTGTSTLKSWPLFSYLDNGQVKDAKILAI